MGSVVSSASTRGHDDPDVTSESETMDDSCVEEEEFHDSIDEDDSARAKAREQDMEEFKKQLELKREQRREILNRHKAEKAELEKNLEDEKKAKLALCETNKNLRELLARNNIEIAENLQAAQEESSIIETVIHMRDEFEKLRSSNKKLRNSLVEANVSLQSANSDIAELTAQNTESIKHINALKEVINVSKTMINLREEQLNELKKKLGEIERSLADREANMLSTDLRQEYEKQLQNIRTLRTLYEERARLAEVTRRGLVREVEEYKVLKDAEETKCKALTTKVEELEAKVDELQEIIENKTNQITSCQFETRGLETEMSAVNKLFSQVLLGYKTKQDLDKLVHRLEENHGLLTHMAERENCAEASSALPKLLLEIVSQVDDEGQENDHSDTADSEPGVGASCSTDAEAHHSQAPQNTSAEEIVQNLPKVWRVLIELLSHQSTPEENVAEKVTTCYKSVETKSGPVLVPSVSQTYIRLKDLIVEKLTLIKEVNRMKQLNGHLETRLQEQEKRLCSVTTELSKTWHVVGRLRRHHHQLHTHEKILKYELQQKRKLLNELKEELEYCREKWEAAREKNSQSERDLRKLRSDFSSRKTKSSAAHNNSAESGYSDERPSDESSESNDESEYVTEPLIRSRKMMKKSFETIPDSSADFNLAAEREDPVSDMLDVADLPLDAQEGDDSHEQISDSCNSESVMKSEKVCVETEDEVGDIADSCVDDSSAVDICVEAASTSDSDSISKKKNNEETTSNNMSVTPTIVDLAAVLKSIQEQKERLAKKDKKLEKLEESSEALLKQSQATVQVGQLLDSTLDHILSRPSTSRQLDNPNLPTKEEIVISHDESVKNGEDIHKTEELCIDNDEIQENHTPKNGVDHDLTNTVDRNFEDTSEKTLTDSTKDDSSTASNLTNAVDEHITAHEKDDLMYTKNITNEGDSNSGNPEPSTSSETDHEARFAARDLRLKRLEEQTKSLVNKVNKTTTKGVKINYKLEELHNIYGSENSRAGTPSEEATDEDKNDKVQSNDEEKYDPQQE